MKDEKLPVDENTLSKSVAILKQILIGNVNKPLQIELSKNDAYIEKISASLELTLEPIIQKKQVPGKMLQGEIKHNEAELQLAVQTCMDAIKSNPQAQAHVKSILLQREDKGFGSQGDSIDLKSYSKNFVVHLECQTCHKQGVIMCAICQGRKQQPCKTCRGQRQVSCMSCRGQRTARTTQGNIETCRDCMGKGTTSCRSCNASGIAPCMACNQTGKITCERCNATGHFSLLEHVDFKLKTNFQLGSSKLPFDLTEYIKNNRKKALRNNEIHVTEDRTSEANEFRVKYIITAPYGTLKFKVGKDKEIDATLFGYEGKLSDADLFLENDFCSKQINAYRNYANGKSSLLSFKKSLNQSRLLKNILIQSAIKNKRDALQYLANVYPIGIRKELLKNLIIISDKALRRITKKRRLLGLAIGLLATSLLYTIYFYGQIRDVITTQLSNYWANFSIDLIVLILGGTLSTYIIHLFSKNAVRKFLSPYLDPGEVIRTLPKTGKSAYFGYLIGLIMYGLMIYYMPQFHKDPPLWVIDLLIKLPL